MLERHVRATRPCRSKETDQAEKSVARTGESKGNHGTENARYFVTVVREGSITAAASLHVTQPTLSRQLAALEDELGHLLYQRNRKGIELTGRASSCAATPNPSSLWPIRPRRKSPFHPLHRRQGAHRRRRNPGHGAIAEAMKRTSPPGITFELYSGTSADLMDNFVRGFYDFLLECELRSHVDMHTLRLPHTDTWGLLVRRDNPWQQRRPSCPRTCWTSRSSARAKGVKVGVLGQWLGRLGRQMDVRATYNLPLNAKFLVRQGIGSAFTYRGLFEANELRTWLSYRCPPLWNPPRARLAQRPSPPAKPKLFWIR